ncbi:hypothetical protein NITMOv2_2754 [Nitrospira moscoviensis]|uniref:Uncharacterized protein n=1 Tax=Nitrospira moscoviensis TaxID=42253 RepID=A0A0K2GE75_NITMO|nr:hypothetical protein NITMOv2_2754 [Nitrospira moscoviensis]
MPYLWLDCIDEPEDWVDRLED